MKAVNKMTFFRLGSLCLAGVLVLLWFVGATSAQSSTSDAGLITKLSGEATYWNQEEQKEPAPAQAFMKVRKGDQLNLLAATSLTLLYFANGRQETWKGPATLVVGDLESASKKPGSQPEVKMISTKVTGRMECATLPLPSSSTAKYGGMETRGPRHPAREKPVAPPPLSPEARRRIKEAERTYQDLRKRAEADDPIPELYFLGVLADYQQFPEMEKLIEAMLAKKPGDPVLKNLKTWVHSQSAGRPAPN